ncbi:Kinesin-like protein KIF2C [Pteropus alecto]|uniref:Kinesin-like protein KIF2C n=1 Tax=Pteropus alecto TaxID=9402 RepID=L5KAI8_PTEAL|nr:Kinesin-like protein KIF2C [Pteropus alecto]
MDSLLQACLFPSLAIEMKCSNGLIHRAKARTVILEKARVSVKWTEGGATKGKEIDFDDMAAINPELSEFLPLYPYNLPLQENVTAQKQKLRSVNFKIPSPKEGSEAAPLTPPLSQRNITAQENDMEVERPASANSRKWFSVPTGPPMATAEMSLMMVSEQVEEQVHSIQGISSPNSVN